MDDKNPTIELKKQIENLKMQLEKERHKNVKLHNQNLILKNRLMLETGIEDLFTKE